MSTQNKPLHTIWDQALKVTIWQNERPEGDGYWYEAVPGRVYTDTQDKAKTAHSFTNGDVLAMAELMRTAYHWIRQQKLRDKHDAKAAARELA